MKAIVAKKYGNAEILEYKEVKKPEVTEDTILVKIIAASINQADIYIMKGEPFPIRFISGLFKPKYPIIGSDIAGIVEEVGENITDFKVGDEVFGQLELNQSGGYAEYSLLKASQISIKPKHVTFSEAAAVSMAGLTAVQGARLGNVQEGSKVLIYGASGGVGTFTLQVCKSLGAHVTAVVSTRNMDVAKASGADKIINYKETVWDKGTELYDVVIAVNGYNKLTRYRDKLTDDGTYVLIGGTMKQIMEVMIKKPFMRDKRNRKFVNFTAKVTKSDLDILSNLLDKKQLRPHIDKEFTLKNTNQAINHFMENKTIGKTIIKVQNK